MAVKGKAPRLGRGLSALMAQPVKIAPPVEVEQMQEGTVEQSASVAVTPPAVATPAEASTADTIKTAPVTAAKASAAKTVTDKNTVEAENRAGSEPVIEQSIVWLKPSVIRPNPHQPRREFDPEALGRLSRSIKDAGLMQPVIVRPVSDEKGKAAGHTHELVAGERRWRAVKLAELETIPAIVHDLDEHQTAEWALVENLQREDLNPMERAQAFAHLVEKFQLSHEQIAQRVGVERPTISNALRLLELDPQVQDWVRQARLTAGHARALAGVNDHPQQRLLAQKTIAQEWSVRHLEQEIRKLAQDTTTAQQGVPLKAQARAAHLADLEQQLGRHLETKVRIRPGRKKGSGTLSIDFYSVDQFDTLLKRLNIDTE